MIAKQLLSSIIAPLHKNDTGEQAFNIMNFHHVRHLPLVENNELICLVSEDAILSQDLDQKISAYNLPKVNPYCYEHEHLFEILQKMALNKLTVMPVIEKNNVYVGLITIEDLLRYFGESYAVTEPGSIIILETDRQNYSLSEIARIAESEGILIFTSWLTSNLDSTILYVTLKLNKHDVSALVNAFQRYDYIVTATFSEEEYIDTLKERYDSLMNYLSV